MPVDPAPDEIVALADARARARRAREWATADELKARIEAAGWKVIDTGTLFDLERAAPPDVEGEGGVIRYGASRSVPSRLGEAPVGVASVVTVVDHDPAAVAGLVRSLVAHAPDGTQLVIVANGLPADGTAGLDTLDAADPGAPGVVVEVVHTATRLGAAAARNAGIRRAVAPVVILADAGLAPGGDLVGPLVAALADPTVAVAGPFGLVSADLRRFEPADGADADMDVDAVDLGALAFRREDAAARGLLDEHFVVPASLDAWWSLVLRDPAGDAPDDETPRRAVQVAGVPVARPQSVVAAAADAGDPGEARLAKKNHYRLLKRFASRRDLLTSAGAHRGTPHDRP